MRKVSVIGLGYVGLPVAVAFGKKAPVIGFDINARRIAELEAGQDRTGEVSPEDLARADITYTHRVQELRRANFHIVTVSTPVDEANQPDLRSLLKASETVGQALKHGDIVVYESTVYPGVTEEVCAPVLERESGLKCGEDFFWATVRSGSIRGTRRILSRRSRKWSPVRRPRCWRWWLRCTAAWWRRGCTRHPPSR